MLSHQAETKGERRSGSHKRLLYCVNVNRTSLDHLLLGVGADIDEMSHGPSIAPGLERRRANLLRLIGALRHWSENPSCRLRCEIRNGGKGLRKIGAAIWA